ncbi:MAG TPA: superoxide dismutase [Xanthobacteraceae bacterium]|nr:superoxide dismutase [Xanthobacteraceae bacterium]
MNRRHTLKLLAATAVAGIAGRGIAHAEDEPAFTLPPLGYAYDALEPSIDTTTMRIHHDNHHAAYVANLNKLAGRWPRLAQRPIEATLADLDGVPAELRTAVRNNLGGHWNHSFFWELMTPGGARTPSEEVAAAIRGAAGGLVELKAAVKAAGLGQFGSGWVWLALGRDGKLAVFATANQDTPLARGAKPILAIDVWEHAYYLKYQSRRADYIDAWWNTLNWDKVAANLRKASA